MNGQRRISCSVTVQRGSDVMYTIKRIATTMCMDPDIKTHTHFVHIYVYIHIYNSGHIDGGLAVRLTVCVRALSTVPFCTDPIAVTYGSLTV